jgi:hypothetical protein
VYNLHGQLDDAESWVFTESELKSLLKDPAYQAMLHRVFASFTVLFLGISPDDVAIDGPLSSLVQLQVQGPPHYWLTDRSDLATDQWAESAGIRVIRYAMGAHHIVEEALADLTSKTAPEIFAPPVVRRTIVRKRGPKLAEPDVMVTMPLEEIREQLNAHAGQLLLGPGGQQKFEDFVSEYDEAVHRAWYTSSKGGRNTLFGYTLEEEVAKGAFGRVFRATDVSGNAVAVKVLLTEIRSDQNLLQSFRRRASHANFGRSARPGDGSL